MKKRVRFRKRQKNFDEGNELEAKELVSGETEYVERVLTLLTIQKKMTDAVTKDVSTEVSDEEAAQNEYAVCKFSRYTTTDEEGNSKTLTDEEKAALKETAAAFRGRCKSGGRFCGLCDRTRQGSADSYL